MIVHLDQLAPYQEWLEISSPKERALGKLEHKTHPMRNEGCMLLRLGAEASGLA
jgi:hypothetical protein